ncbi:MAG TPA: BamA/TamA family outer membrane protein, partial [Blastocatellia bacterium]|nr:BamA/TamA family outer membrane protein [Blastocatellia bacterium]
MTLLILIVSFSAQVLSPQSTGQQSGQPPGQPSGNAAERRLRIERIVFQGARVFSDSDFRSRLQHLAEKGFIDSLRHRDVYTPEKGQQDALLISEFLGEKGYLRAFVGEPRVEYVNPADEHRTSGDISVRIVFTIAEGSLHKLRSLNIAGSKLISTEDAQAQFDLKPGDALGSKLIERGINRLRAVYGRNGYLQFTATIDLANIEPAGDNDVMVTLQITLNEGSQYTLGNLEFPGRKRTREDVLLRAIPLNPGEVFDYLKWERGLYQINRLGLFDPVSPADAEFKYDEKKGEVAVTLKLVERDHQRVDFSGGGGSVGGATAGVDYSNINLTGRGDRFSASLRLGTREESASASYSTAIQKARPLGIDLSGFYKRIEYIDVKSLTGGQLPLFVEKTWGANFGITAPLGSARSALVPQTTAGLLYSISETDLRNSIETPASNQPVFRLGSLTPYLLHDTLDRAFDPRRGSRLAFGTEIGARAIGGSLNTVKPVFDYRFFAPVAKHDSAEPVVIGMRLRASHIRAFGDPFLPDTFASVAGVPFSKRVFVGGEVEVRGYTSNSISPIARVDRFVIVEGEAPVLTSSDIQPVGGDSQLIFNGELRTPLFWRFSAAAFADYGASYNLRNLSEEQFARGSSLTVVRPADINYPSWRVSTGVELRFLVPAVNLPIRLIFAANPNAQRSVPAGSLLVPEKRFGF